MLGESFAVLYTALPPAGVIEISRILRIAFQHGTILISGIVVVASDVKSIMSDRDRDVLYDVHHVTHLADPGIVKLMWTEIPKNFEPGAGHYGEYGIGMLVVRGYPQHTEIFAGPDLPIPAL